MMNNKQWWKHIPLAKMSRAEWESLCDHCGKCCLNKLEDEDDKMVYYTDIACDLLNAETCQCSDYAHRSSRVPDCLHIRMGNLEQLYWMPPSCAYRLLYENKDLPSWHHLVSGDKNSIHQAGQSVKGRFVFAQQVDGDDWQEHVVEWPLDIE